MHMRMIARVAMFSMVLSAALFGGLNTAHADKCVRYPNEGYNCGSPDPWNCDFCESDVCLRNECPVNQPTSEPKPFCWQQQCKDGAPGTGIKNDECWKDCGGNHWEKGLWDCCACNATCPVANPAPSAPACSTVSCPDGAGRGVSGDDCWGQCSDGAWVKGTWDCCSCQMSCAGH